MDKNRVYGTGNVFLESITDFQNIETARMLQSNCLSIKFVNNGNKRANHKRRIQ